MNYVNDVLKLLGVEVGEEFKIKNEKGVIVSHTYSINDELIVYKNVNGTRTRAGDVYFGEFLLGNLEIVKLPLKPRYGDKYYYYSDRDWNDTVICEEWFNDATDLAMWKVGNVFKTKEEALEKGKELFEKLKKEYGDC